MKNKSIVFGILSLVFGCFSVFFTCFGIGFIFGAISLVFGIISLCINEKYIAIPITGICISVVFSALSFIVFIATSSDNETREHDSSGNSAIEFVENNKNDYSTVDDEAESEEVVEETFTVQETESEEPICYIKESSTILEYVGYELDEEYIVLYFNFTNNSSEAQRCDFIYSMKAFQDGIELDDCYIHLNEESKNESREIKKGVTLKVAESFELRNYDSDLEIEITPYSVWDDEILCSFTIKLNE